MAFTTQVFLFVFFPLSFLLYYLTSFLQSKGFLSKFLTKIRGRDLLLIAISCGFYAWAGFSDLPRFLLYILLIWLLGRLIQRCRKSRLGFVMTEEDSQAWTAVIKSLWTTDNWNILAVRSPFMPPPVPTQRK